MRTSKEALELLAPAASSGDQMPFDLILKEHEPQNGANSCRLLRKMARTDLLAKIPVVCEWVDGCFAYGLFILTHVGRMDDDTSHADAQWYRAMMSEKLLSSA